MRVPESEGIRIRAAGKNDAMRLFEIDHICFPASLAYSREEFILLLEDSASVCLAAEDNGGIIGFVIGRIEGGRKGHVITVDVVPEARRRKVATRLMERLHEELFLRNAASVFLEVSTKNTPAQRFYQGLGYEKKGVLRRYYRTCGDAYLMTRRL